jgi:glutamate--cysteine ligase
MERGVSHIELRMIDLNPFLPWGVDERDLQFAHLLIVWLSGREPEEMNDLHQIRAAANFKKAAHYDLHRVNYRDREGRSIPMDEAGMDILRQMMTFYQDGPEWISGVLQFQYDKLYDPSARYTADVVKWFGDDFAGCGLTYAKERQRLLCANCSAQAV